MQKFRFKYYIFTFLLIISFSSYSQNSVNLSLQFLSNDLISEVNFDKESFLDYSNEFRNKLENVFKNHNTQRDILLIQTIHCDKSPTIELYSRPGLSTEEEKMIITDLKSINSINSKLVDFSLLYIININGGCTDANLSFTPKYSTPRANAESELHTSDLKRKYQLIKSWCIKEALPIIAEFETTIGSATSGTKALGEQIKSTNFNNNQDIYKLSEKNNNYWKAIIENTSHDNLIPVSRVFMHAANGEFDYAYRLAKVLMRYTDNKSIPYYLMEEFLWRIKIFYNDLNIKIENGDNFNNNEDFQKAIDYYKDILKIYPYSAIANYEVFYSSKSVIVKKDSSLINDNSNWEKLKSTVYLCDPLFNPDLIANTPEEAYLKYRREKLRTLFIDKTKHNKDLIEYADICLELKEYGIAAQLYWIILNTIQKDELGKKNVLAYFLYCLNKLDNTEIINNFKGDFEKEFLKINKENEKAMKRNKAYKYFGGKRLIIFGLTIL